MMPATRLVSARVLLLCAPLLVAQTSSAVAQAGPGAPAASRLSTLLSAPGGDTLAVVRDPSAVRVLAADGDWSRVSVEGWVASAEIQGVAAPPDGITLAALRADPQGHAGREVRWRIQFIAHQRADALRSDMTLGEQYMLARDPGGEAGLVYITVPPALASATAALTPLDRIEIGARVRVARSPLTGHPILELTEIRR